jgi:beta-glucanase (GH16 family)
VYYNIKSSLVVLAVVAIVGTNQRGKSAQAADPVPPGWKLTWSDEFEGDGIDRSKWDFDLGNGFYDYNANQWISGWGNGELQYYTREPENAWVGGGMLHIRAIKESFQGAGYTSARLKSRKRDGSPLFNQTYGRFEFRAKLPTSQGVWPALWMLPQEDKYGSWPLSGEIDVMEARGQEPHKVLGTLHYGSRWPGNVNTSRDLALPKQGTIAEFHIYALEWEPGEIRWYVDGQHLATQSFWWSSVRDEGKEVPKNESDLSPWPAPFDQPFYIVMNLAIGGGFVGNPNKTTVLPAEMQVDYVRAYEKIGGYGKAKPRSEGKLPFVK